MSRVVSINLLCIGEGAKQARHFSRVYKCVATMSIEAWASIGDDNMIHCYVYTYNSCATSYTIYLQGEIVKRKEAYGK